ncbi:MAG: type II secretion system protein [Alphaproteobacteria bacterium]|nr:type II secretion system protein [Alphaproteobacteria bacterium]
MATQHNKKQSGRTLLEMISVLVVISILILASLLGYNTLRDRSKRQETIKTITELAIRYKATPIKREPGEEIPVRHVYPVPTSMRSGTGLKAADGNGQIYLKAGVDTSSFSVFAANILNGTCRELLESGNYEAVVYSFEGKERTISKEALNKSDKKDAIIRSICGEGAITSSVQLVFGNQCTREGYYYANNCHGCPNNQSEDIYGDCCESLNACGVCRCPNEGVCDTTSKECVECTKHSDCKNPSKPKCDPDTQSCVECLEKEDCAGKGENYKCDLSTHTCTECKEEYGVQWNDTLGICDCGIRLASGAQCSPDNNCCQLGLACRRFAEDVYKCSECETHPDCTNPDYPVCKDNTCQRCPTPPTKNGDECYSFCDACPADIGLTCGTEEECICSGEGLFQHWHATKEKCVQCLKNDHCAGTDTPWCDPSDNECKKCNSNYGTGGTFECPSNLPWCDAGTCRACSEHETNKYWSDEKKQCVQCLESVHCPENQACMTQEEGRKYTCVPCNTPSPGYQNTNLYPLGIRVKDAQSCYCPVDYSRKIGSTATSGGTYDGGNWYCGQGCSNSYSCAEDHYCSNGSCIPCANGWYRKSYMPSYCLPYSECAEGECCLKEETWKNGKCEAPCGAADTKEKCQECLLNNMQQTCEHSATNCQKDCENKKKTCKDKFSKTGKWKNGKCQAPCENKTSESECYVCLQNAHNANCNVEEETCNADCASEKNSCISNYTTEGLWTKGNCENKCGPNQVLLQYNNGYNTCGSYACVDVISKNQLIQKTGIFNGRKFYLPPVEGYWDIPKYRMTHESAARFCEHYGLHLASVNEACAKDYAYDSGWDCPNFVNYQNWFSFNGINYHLSQWGGSITYDGGMGTFWLADNSGDVALRVTYSCGNNHVSHRCNNYYPLCTD